MKDIVFLLVPGFGSSEKWFEFMFDSGNSSVKPVSFLKKLKKLGHVHMVTFPWFNVDYYYTDPNKKHAAIWNKIYKKYKPHSPDIDFTLKDLDYTVICKKMYKDIRKKYPTQKIVPIGHSYGGPIVYIFSKLYKNECKFVCILDGSPISKQLAVFHYDKYEKKNKKMVDKIFPNDQFLQKVLKKIKSNPKSNADIKRVLNLVSFKSTVWEIKHFKKNMKLYCPTIFFRSIYIKPSKFGKLWNMYSVEEQKLYTGKYAKYIFYLEAPHFLWYNQKVSDDIILNIKQLIKI